MSPGNKISVNRAGSKGNLSNPFCPFCGFPKSHKHGCYYRKGFHRPQGNALQEPVAVQRYLCRSPPCGRTFSTLPEEVLPYCRFLWGGLLSIAHDRMEGKTSYWIAKHRWGLSLRVILRAVSLVERATTWLARICREAALHAGSGLRSLVDSVRERFSWAGLARRWFHGLYPCRAGNIFNPHNLGIKRL